MLIRPKVQDGFWQLGILPIDSSVLFIFAQVVDPTSTFMDDVYNMNNWRCVCLTLLCNFIVNLPSFPFCQENTILVVPSIVTVISIASQLRRISTSFCFHGRTIFNVNKDLTVEVFLF